MPSPGMLTDPPRRFPSSLDASQTTPIVGSGRFSREIPFLQIRRRHPPSSAEVNVSRPGLAGQASGRAARLLRDELTRTYAPLLMRP